MEVGHRRGRPNTTMWFETKVLPPVFTLENLAGWSSHRNWKSVVKRETLLLRAETKKKAWGLGISCGRRGGFEQPPGIPGSLSDGVGGGAEAGRGGLRVSEN